MNEYLKTLIEIENYDAIYELGLKFYAGDGVELNYQAAKECFEIVANKGVGGANLYLGLMYYYGNGTEIDYEKARVYLEQKNIYMANNITKKVYADILYKSGTENINDMKKAYEVYQNIIDSKEANHDLVITSKFKVGYMLYNGLGVEQNYQKAKDLFVDCYFETENSLMKSLTANALGKIHYLYTDEADYAKAKDYFEYAATNNDNEAKCFLGEMYYKGYGVEKDLYKAKCYFEEASAADVTDANCYLGLMYFNGEGVERNTQTAKYYFHKAEDKNSNVKHYLGLMFYNGDGEARDYIKAKNYFEESAKCGNKTSNYYLGKLYYWGDGVETDHKKARTYFEISAENNIEDSKEYVGKIYTEEAKDYLNKAANVGNEEAKNLLKLF